MKIQKTFFIVLLIFFLSVVVSISVQAKGNNEKVKERGSKVVEKGFTESLGNFAHHSATNPASTAMSIVVSGKDGKGGKNIKKFLKNSGGKYAGNLAVALDIAINAEKMYQAGEEGDFFGISKISLDAAASTFLAESATLFVVGAVGSSPIGIGAGLGVGLATAWGYNEIDPLRIFDRYSFIQAYDKAQKSLYLCDIANAFKQINIAKKAQKDELNKVYKEWDASQNNYSNYVMSSDYRKNSSRLKDLENVIKHKEEKHKYIKDYLPIIILLQKRIEYTDSVFFKAFREYYIKELQSIKNTNTIEACAKYNSLQTQLGSCGKVFLETSAPSLIEEKKKLVKEMNNNNRLMSSERWNTLDNFRKSTSCSNIDSLLEKFANFQDKMNQTNLYVYAYNDCKKKDTGIDMELQNVASELYNKRDQCRLEDRALLDKKEAEEDVAIDKAIADKKKEEEEDDIGEEIRKKECGNNYFKLWNKVSKEVDCICPENLMEVNDRCLTENDIGEEIRKKECGDNYFKQWNKVSKEVDCICPENLTEVNDRCLTENDIGEEIRKKECGDNYFKQWNKVSKEVDCICPENLTEVNDRCLTEDDAKEEIEMAQSDHPTNGTFLPGAVQDDWLKDCNKMLPGSIAKGGACVCPKGMEKSQKLKICVEIAGASENSSSGTNKTGEKVLNQIIYRIEGSGYVPHYGGGSFQPSGHRDILMTLEESATEKNIQSVLAKIQSILDKLSDNNNRDICNTQIGAFPSANRPPSIWEEFNVRILRGPTSDLSNVKLENTWKSKGDGPSLGEIKEASGCKK